MKVEYFLAAGVFVAALGFGLVHSESDPKEQTENGQTVVAQAEKTTPAAPLVTQFPDKFQPPLESDIPDNELGKVIRYGKDLFDNTQQLRGTHVGNSMNCVNCHLDSGRKADSAPMWAAWPMYPAYRSKNNRVNTMEERIEGCFMYSMNGKPPAKGSKEMVALVTYMYWMSKGTPTGIELEGRGYPALPKPEQAPDVTRGAAVYEANCAVCHGNEGQGQKVKDVVVFPPLWGPESFNWGAGMHRINTAASFIKYNMPLGQGGRLTDQEAWDVAAFVNSHERPQDPRHKGDLAETDATYHDENCFYGDEHHGHALGSKPAAPAGLPRN